MVCLSGTELSSRLMRHSSSSHAGRRHTYPELLRACRCRFVIFGIETGGRWSEEAATFLRLSSVLLVTRPLCTSCWLTHAGTRLQPPPATCTGALTLRSRICSGDSSHVRWHSILHPRWKHACRPHQYALSNRAGLDALVHHVQARCARDQALTVVPLDASAACDGVSRQTIFLRFGEPHCGSDSKVFRLA